MFEGEIIEGELIVVEEKKLHKKDGIEQKREFGQDWLVFESMMGK